MRDMSINAGTTVCCGKWPRIQNRRPFHAGIGSRVIQLRAFFEKKRDSIGVRRCESRTSDAAP